MHFGQHKRFPLRSNWTMKEEVIEQWRLALARLKYFQVSIVGESKDFVLERCGA